MKKLLAVVTIPLLISACSNSGQDMASTITIEDLQHHNWILTKIDNDTVVTPARMSPPNLEIGEKMTTNGNAGCNIFFGQAELKNNQFRIEKMGMTMKMCIGDVMQTEMTFSQSLSDWSDITLTKDMLILKNKAHKLTFSLSDWK